MSDAISLYSDFKVYEPEFNAGVYEALYQNSMIFNQASRGGIGLVTQIQQGHYLKSAFFKQIASLVTRQDITAITEVDSKKLEQSEYVGVKLHRKIGPVQVTPNAFKLAGLGLDTREGSMALGRLVGDAVSQRMASDAILAAIGAVNTTAALINDITSATIKYATIKGLHRTRLKWGDQLTKLGAWLMHSISFGDVFEDTLDIELESVAGVSVASGNVPGLLGAGLVVSDNANLVNSSDPDTYNILGMSPGAVTVIQSQLSEIWINKITGLEQLTLEIQGEYANTVMVDGFAWNTSTGGVNPTDAYLGSSTYWTAVRTDTTGLPLVKMVAQAKEG